MITINTSETTRTTQPVFDVERRSSAGLHAPDHSRPATWVEDHGTSLYRFALSQVRDADAAAEVVQDTFVAALESGRAYEGRSAFRTWLMGIARHKSLDYFRHRSRERASGDLCAEMDGSPEAPRDAARGLHLASPAVDPEEAATSSELGASLQAALGGLSTRLSRAFVLCALQGLDSHEACAILGCTRSALWVRLHRARRKLRRALVKAGASVAGLHALHE